MFCFLTDPRVASCKESENREGKNRRQNRRNRRQNQKRKKEERYVPNNNNNNITKWISLTPAEESTIEKKENRVTVIVRCSRQQEFHLLHLRGTSCTSYLAQNK